MLRFLFPRLTSGEERGATLFAGVVAEARKPHWFEALGVPDTLDGRFSVLATVTALATVRLERVSDSAEQASVALAERFIESMDHEHRQLGYGDPTIGKIVRRLTGSLARRVEIFRSVTDGRSDWDSAARSSLKGLEEAGTLRSAEAGAALHLLWERLERTSEADIIDGNIA